MLTDKLKENEVLKDLTDGQLTAILAASKADEIIVMTTKVDEAKKSVYADIKKTTGLDVDSIPSIKTAFDGLNSKISDQKELSDKVTALEAKNADLISKGVTDEVVKKELATATTLLKSTQSQVVRMKADHAKAIIKKDNEFTATRLGDSLTSATKGLTFNKDIAEKDRNILIGAAKTEFLATYEATTLEGQTVYVDKVTKQPLMNKDNGFKPTTLDEFMKDSLSGILAKDGGSGSGGDGNGGNGTFDLSGYKTQNQAWEAIEKEAKEKGYAFQSDEYNALIDQEALEALPTA